MAFIEAFTHERMSQLYDELSVEFDKNRATLLELSTIYYNFADTDKTAAAYIRSRIEHYETRQEEIKATHHIYGEAKRYLFYFENPSRLTPRSKLLHPLKLENLWNDELDKELYRCFAREYDSPC